MNASRLLPRLILAAAVHGAPSATAQNYVPPPSQFITDPNGVDPKSNILNFSEKDASIGQDGREFSLVRGIPTHKILGRQEFGTWIFNFTGYVYSKYDASDDPDKFHRYGPTTLSAVLGNRSFSFRKEYLSAWDPSDPATSINSSGSSPALTITITTGAGEVLTYLQANEPCEYIEAETYCGRIASYVKPDGERWDFTYGLWSSSTKRRVSKVVSNLGYVALFEYASSSTDQPSKACLVNASVTDAGSLSTCPSGATTVTYSLSTTSGTITKPNSEQVLYTATSDSILVRRGSSSTTADFYFARGLYGGDSTYARGTSTAGAGGDRWTYDATYVDPCPSCVAYPGQLTKQIVAAPDSTTTIYEWRDFVVGTTHFIDPLPNKLTNALSKDALLDYGITGGFIFGPFKLKTLTLPEGNAEEFTYDSRANTTSRTLKGKPSPGIADSVTSATYPASCSGSGFSVRNCNLPISVTDARGNSTSYVFSDVHGGKLSEVGPAVGGVSPAKKYSYTLRKAWIKNSSSGFVQPSTGVYLLTEERSCRTTALNLTTGACVGGTSDLVVTTYDYGPDTGVVGNNLWLRGKTVAAFDPSSSSIVSLRSCYGYDANGRKIWETSPRAGLLVCN